MEVTDSSLSAVLGPGSSSPRGIERCLTALAATSLALGHALGGRLSDSDQSRAAEAGLWALLKLSAASQRKGPEGLHTAAAGGQVQNWSACALNFAAECGLLHE